MAAKKKTVREFRFESESDWAFAEGENVDKALEAAVDSGSLEVKPGETIEAYEKVATFTVAPKFTLNKK